MRHLFQHSGERPFRCQNCESGFTSINRLKEHIKKKHPDTPAAQSIMEPINAVTPPITTTISTNNPAIQTLTSTQTTGTILNSIPSKTKYTPIAPAPAKFATTATPTIMISAQPACQNLPILTQGPNGTMLLVSNPTPTFTASPFLFPAATPTPLLLAAPSPVIYGMPSFFQPQVQSLTATTSTASSTLPSAFITAPHTCSAPTVMATPPTSNSSSKDEITVLNEKGESQKYDILERAILEIPNMEDSIAKQV